MGKFVLVFWRHLEGGNPKNMNYKVKNVIWRQPESVKLHELAGMEIMLRIITIA